MSGLRRNHPSLSATPEFSELCQEGIVLFRQGKYEEAVEKYYQATQLDSTDAVCWSNLVACYEKVEKYSEMAKAAHSCTKADPTFVKGHHQTATAQMGAWRRLLGGKAFAEEANFTSGWDLIITAFGVDCNAVNKDVKNIVRKNTVPKPTDVDRIVEDFFGSNFAAKALAENLVALKSNFRNCLRQDTTG